MVPIPLVAIVLILIAIKIYNRLTMGVCKSYTCLVGKTAIVTGANTGIGFVTALDFAKRGARVILACRNRTLAEEARQQIITVTGNVNVDVKIINMSSLQSVRDFAEEVKRSEPRLDILVNNAGAGAFLGKKSDDGLDMVMQINYYAPFLLTNLLMDLLIKSKGARVVNLGSVMARYAKIDANDLNRYPEGHVIIAEWRLYANSKLCDLIWSNELGRRLRGTGVTVNCVHPGAINTGIWRRIPKYMQATVTAVESIFFKTVEEGAQTTIYAAVDKSLDGVTSKYFMDCKECSQYKTVRDEAYGKKLWARTMDDLGLKESDLCF